MRTKFSFSELGGILTSTKKPDIVKIASGVDAENAPVADAMESVCRVADVLDEIGKSELADELMKSTQALLAGIAKRAEDEEDEAGEADKEDSGEKEEKEKEEVMSVKCPHCDKEFDVVVEYEAGDGFEIETPSEEAKEHMDKEKEEEHEGQEENGPGTIR
jgi:hypothetical protein